MHDAIAGREVDLDRIELPAVAVDADAELGRVVAHPIAGAPPRTRRRRAPRRLRSCRRRPAARVLPVGLAVAVVVTVVVARAPAGAGRASPSGSASGRAARCSAARAERAARGGGASVPGLIGGAPRPSRCSTAGGVGRRGLAAQLGGHDRAQRLHVGRALQPLGQQRAEVLADRARLAAVERGAERLDALRLAAQREHDLAGRGDAARAHDGDREPPFFTPPATVTPAGADFTFTPLAPPATATATWPSAGIGTESALAACAAGADMRSTASVRSRKAESGEHGRDGTAGPADAHQGVP